jgi:hypothetical protein
MFSAFFAVSAVPSSYVVTPSRLRAHFRQHQLSNDLCRGHLLEPGCASIGKWADFRHGELLATSVSIG